MPGSDGRESPTRLVPAPTATGRSWPLPCARNSRLPPHRGIEGLAPAGPSCVWGHRARAVNRLPRPVRERNPETHDEKLSYLRELREAAVHSASEAAVEKQHAKGKMTARERIEKLLDPG